MAATKFLATIDLTMKSPSGDDVHSGKEVSSFGVGEETRQKNEETPAVGVESTKSLAQNINSTLNETPQHLAKGTSSRETTA